MKWVDRLLRKKGSPRPPRRVEPTPEVVPPYMARSVFEDCFNKDRRLAWALRNRTFSDFLDRWVEAYPEDFPARGLTCVADRTAIKTAFSATAVNSRFRELMAEKVGAP